MKINNLPPQYNTNNLPKISIVTPSFNQAAYLEATILSILNQNYPNLEYIIIDGGSTDGSVDIIKKYENKLAYWVSEPDGGQYQAIQKGFDKSTGEIMTWLNSDDMYHQNSLFVVAEIFSQFTDIQWLTGIPTFYNEQGDMVRVVQRDERWSLFRFLLRGRSFDLIEQESVFWRRTLWERTGSYISTKFNLASDFELWSRFFQHTPLVAVQTILGGFRFRQSNQKSLEQWADYYQETQIIKQQYPLSKQQEIQLFLCEIYVKIILRFVRDAGIIRKITDKLFEYPPQLRYNRFLNAFEFIRH